MMIYSRYLCVVLLFLVWFGVHPVCAQDTTSSDGLLKAARSAAFDRKDYPQAKAYLYKALSLSPDYSDIRIFLGRIYTWTHVYDSAEYCFRYVLRAHPDYEDATVAWADLAYWNDHYEQALTISQQGLTYHPASEEILLRKAKALAALRRFQEADTVVRRVLHLNKDNTAARALENNIKELSVRNKVNIGYDYIYFDKQFSNPWHLVSLDYGRSTKIGTITGRLNYANMFATNGMQYELEAYPHISRTFYAYMEGAYSSSSVFPLWRAGFSLYANLPSSFEGELGFRYLDFSGSPTWIYTGYLGKYYKSWLFGARTYLTPATYSNTISNSYALSARYYYGSADDLIGATVSYGLSPDDRYQVIQLGSVEKLTSYGISCLFKKKLMHTNVLTLSASWVNQDYLPGKNGNQYQIGAAWQHRF